MSKKTETIEIRVSPELKSDLARRSQRAGRSMSDVVRGLIEAEAGGGPVPQLTQGGSPMTRSQKPALARAFAFGFPVLALAGVYLAFSQTPVSASAEIRSHFASVDRNLDGLVSADEVRMVLVEDEWEADPVCGTAEAEPDEPCTLDAAVTMQLDRADSDGNGTVDFEEFEAVSLRDRAEDFLYFDIDENGYVTADEYAGHELWDLLDPEIAAQVEAEDGFVLNAACRAQLEAEELLGLAEICGVTYEVGVELAAFDSDRDGRVSLREFLEH